MPVISDASEEISTDTLYAKHNFLNRKDTFFKKLTLLDGNILQFRLL